MLILAVLALGRAATPEGIAQATGMDTDDVQGYLAIRPKAIDE